MANVIDIIVSKQAQAELDKVIASLKLTHEEIIKINQQGLKINSGASPKNPVQMNQSVKETIALTKELTEAEQNLLTNTKKVLDVQGKQIQNQIKQNNLDKSTIDLKNKEARERERNEKAAAKEEQKIAQLSNYYNKTQQQLNTIQQAYNNLAVKKERYNNLSSFEENRLKTLQVLTEKYNGTLKTVDATIGKHTRNVGNYASGFNPLSNSINQLGREMPAFANSVQTGFMAISNNLPIFFDAMGQVIAQNKELQAQGKPTKNVLGQLASSLFSFQTLLSVGVTLLTLYGKEIVNWVSSLMGASQALDELNKNQKEFNNARFQGKKDAQSDIIELKKYLAVYNDTSLSLQDREIAYKKLSQQYAYYIKNVSDATMVNGKYSNGVNKLLVDLEKQKALEKETNLQVTNKQKLLDLEKELTSLKLLENQKKKELDVQNKIVEGQGVNRANRINQLKAEDNYNSVLNKRIKIENDINSYQNSINKNQVEIIKLTKDRIGLEYTEDKQREKTAKKKKEKIDLNFREIESEYDLRRAILERQKAEISDRMDNESLNLNDRLKAREEFSKKSIELLDLELRKEKEVLLFKQAEDFSKNNLALKNKEISYAQYSENIKDINKRVSNEIATSDLAYSLKWNDLLNSDAEFYKKIQEQKVRFTNDTNKLILDSETKKFEKISKDETKTLLTRNLAHQKYIDNSKQQLQIDKMLEMSKSTSQEQLDNIIKKYQLLGEALDELATPYETARKGFEDYLKSITSNELDSALNKIGVSSLKMFLDIDENGQTTFSKMWELAETTQEKFALAFKGIGDVFQEVAGLMSQASQKRSEEELYRLEQQKNVSLQFAGESAIAKEEIERQYEEKRKAIARRQAESEKRLAIFNIGINTAQAIIATLAKTPLPKGLPLAIAVGAIGAAQIAMVSSQSIPEFWKGTDNAPEGLAWTQEKGAEVITDKKGNVKTLGNNKGAQLTYLEKGDKVYKSQQDYINKTLVGAGIQPMRENNSLTSSDFNNGISKLAKTMQSNKGSNTQVFLNNKQINTDSLRGIGKKV